MTQENNNKVGSIITATLLAAFLSACATGAEVGTITNNSSSDDAIAISGSLSGDLASTSKVLILETSDNEAEIVAIEDGTFSLEVDEGSYSITLLDEDNSPIALLVQDGESIFEVSADTDLGALDIDLESDSMSSSTSLANAAASVSKSVDESDVDLSDLTAVVTDGAEDNGVDVENLLSEDTLDGDIDGDLVPNFLDNDNNQDGIYDVNQGMSICRFKVDTSESTDADADLSALTGVSCHLFDNLKLPATALFNGDGDIMPHTDSHILAFHLAVPSALVSLIDNVTVEHMPNFADGTVAPNAGGYAFASYPTVGDAWTDHGHELPHATDTGGNDVYSIWINASDDPKPSVMIYKMTLTNGTIVRFATRLAYVFNTPPKVNDIDDDGIATAVTYPITEGDAGTRSNPFAISGSGTLELTADRPLTAAGGIEVCGMSINAHIFYLDASGAQMNTTAVMSTSVADSGACIPAVDLVLSLDQATDLPTTYDGDVVDAYQVDLTVTGAQGDNAAEIFYFTR